MPLKLVLVRSHGQADLEFMTCVKRKLWVWFNALVLLSWDSE